MDRLAFITIFVLFLISTAMYFAPFGIRGSTYSIWFYLTFLVCGISLSLIIQHMRGKYVKEYDKAYIMSYSQKAKYGWYALIFFLSTIIIVIFYAILTKR